MHGRHSPKQSRRSSHAQRLLAWYDLHRRDLPWRARPGEAVDPYRIWLSEIMLQQTTVQAVAGYYRKFIARWPTVGALAKAPLDEVLAAWAGLGYYARARNLHAAAKIVAGGGRFPATVEDLRKLPGVGAYTASAVAAIAYGAREAAMDANAERVIARLFAVEEALPGAKTKLLALGKSLVPERRAGDFAQALMDLGAGICTVKRPACGKCPWTDECEARKRDIAERLPAKAPKRARPLRRGAAFVARDGRGAVLLVKRPEKGLLGGMLQPPLGPWSEEFPSVTDAVAQAPFRAAWKKLPGLVRHTFTHFELEIEVWAAEVKTKTNLSWPAKSIATAYGRHPGDKVTMMKERLDGPVPPTPRLRRAREGSLGRRSFSEGGKPGHDKLEVQWVPANKLKNAALPTAMRKILEHALDDGGPLFRHVKSARKR